MIIHEEEVPMGYPAHIDRVVGHLAEASREGFMKYPDLANAIREFRLRVMNDPKYYPPYKDLLSYVAVLTACDAQNLPIPELPDALKPTPSG
jgi:hypothetical protein